MRLRFDPRRLAVVTLLLVLLVPLIAACGGGGDDDEDPTASASGGTVTTASGDDATSAATAGNDGDATSETGGSATPGASGGTTTSGTSGDAAATATTSQAPATTPSATNTPAPTMNAPSGFAWGWNVALRGDDQSAEHNDQTIQAVKDSGFTWVRFQLEWSQFERADDQWDPLPADRKIEALNAAGINVLLVLAKAPDWATAGAQGAFLSDYGQFQEFAAVVADRYKGKVQAYEVWNEQNLAHEVGGNVRVEDYFELLRAGANGIRAADPDATVVFGGLTPNGLNDPSVAIDDVEYLKLLYQFRGGEIRQYFDVLGAHVNSTHNPPDTMWPDNPSDEQGWNDNASFYFRRAEQLRQVMVDNGDEAKPVWLTEFGWTTANQAAGYEYGANNTEQEVADYLVRSYEICTTEWDWCTGAFAWNLNWSTLAPPEDEKSPWSALNADWSPRPAYEALKGLTKE